MTPDPYTQLRSTVVSLERLIQHGCSDHHCRLVKRPRGQGTNGGCKCIRNLKDIALMVASDAESVIYVMGSLPVIDRTDKPSTTNEE